jgi:hypothetical protein
MALTHVDEKLCYQILHEYKIHNAEVYSFCVSLYANFNRNLVTGEGMESDHAFGKGRHQNTNLTFLWMLLFICVVMWIFT